MRYVIAVLFSVGVAMAQSQTPGTGAIIGGTCATGKAATVIGPTGIPTCDTFSTIPVTTKTLAGDGSGNAVPVTGVDSDCVRVDGTSGGCGGGSGVTSVILAGTTNQITATGTCTITATGTCTLSLPSGLILPGTIDGLTITTTTGTLTIASAKVLTVNKSIALDGTDGVTITFPTTNATMARTDAGQTFAGTQTFSSTIAGSINGNAATVSGFTAGAGTLTGPATTGVAATLAGTETLTGKTVDGVTPTTFGFLDPTSSVQTQLNSKGPGTVTTVGFTGGVVSVANPTTAPAFTVAMTSGGVVYGSSASTWASSAAGTAGHLMLWGGAGTAPTDGGAPGGSGTVTSIICGTGLTGGTITSTGTCAADSTYFNANWAQLAAANTFSAGATQTFQDSATTGGARFVPAADPSSPVAGNCKTTLPGRWECWDGSAWQISLSASDLAFSTILAGTNAAALLIGTGGSLNVSGSGTINATSLGGSAAALYAKLASPTFTTPTLGVATATSINKVAITAPGTSATLTIANGKTLTASNTLTFTGTDSSSVALGGGGTVAYTANDLSVFAATTSAQLAGVLSDETGTGLAVFGTSPTLTTPAITTSATLSRNGIGVTSADGYILQNTTAAAAGAQQWSPRLHFIGQGWKTNSTAASQTVDWIMEAQTIQSALIPVSNLAFSVNVGTTGYSPAMILVSTSDHSPLHSSPQFGVYDSDSGSSAGVNVQNAFCAGINPSSTVFQSDGGACLSGGVGAGLAFRSVGIATWSSGTNPLSGADTGFDRDAAGIVGVINGTQGTTAANYRALKASAYYSGGTTFTATGLSVGTLVGGATAGTFTLGANGPGTVVVTMGNSATAPTGWNCSVNDRTTLSVLTEQSASTTTTATFNFPAGALSGDVASFGCQGY